MRSVWCSPGTGWITSSPRNGSFCSPRGTGLPVSADKIESPRYTFPNRISSPTGIEEGHAMAMWDKLFKKKDEGSGRLNPIVQKNPAPAAAPRVSNARPVAKPAAPVPEKPTPERETKSRKKQSDGGTKRMKATDDQSLVKRGLLRQSQGDHDGAI